MSIQKRLESIKAKLGQKAELIAVSKTRSDQEICMAYRAGQRHFGENKVQELAHKAENLASDCPDIIWHFIGHLQSNKVNKLLSIPQLKYIHSIDDLEILDKILQKKSLQCLKLFLQVNTSHEQEKAGFENQQELIEAAKKIQASAYDLQGLMTISKIRTDDFTKDAHLCFAKLLELKLALDQKLQINLDLSMGMSNDYTIALEYQSDWVRVGTAIFGERKVTP